MRKAGTAVVMVAALVSLAAAADGPSVERGKELFNGTKLGTSGKSCASCHFGGKGLEHAFAHNDAKLGAIINRCIAMPLKGNPLDPGSANLKSLILYIRSFANLSKLLIES